MLASWMISLEKNKRWYFGERPLEISYNKNIE
jgi:hypothetical protein